MQLLSVYRLKSKLFICLAPLDGLAAKDVRRSPLSCLGFRDGYLRAGTLLVMVVNPLERIVEMHDASCGGRSARTR